MLVKGMKAKPDMSFKSVVVIMLATVIKCININGRSMMSLVQPVKLTSDSLY